MEILFVFVGISVLLSAVTLVLVFKNMAGRTTQVQTQNQIQTDFHKVITQNAVDLSSVMAKTTAEVRQDIAEKLNEKFVFIGKELREDISKLESKVNERLESIGKDVQTKLDKNIQDGFAQFQKVQETLAGAEKQLSNLNAVGQSIQELNNVLNLPHLRGKLIGEGNLERLLADFLPAGFYEKQYSIEGNLVDFVIKFPHINLVLPIDSKFSLEQVSAIFESTSSPDDLKNARKRLAEITKQNAREIKTKYIKPKLGTTDYALMYLPSETLYFEVIRDTDLWGAMAELKVFPVSPNTFAITVNSIGKSLQYYEMAKGVQKTITKIQTAQDHLMDFKKRFDDIGDKLSRAQDSFQKANTHFSHYSSSIERLTASVDQPLPVASPLHAALVPPIEPPLPTIKN